MLVAALTAAFALTACKDEKTAQQLIEVQTRLAEVEKNHQQALATVAEKHKEVERLQALVKEAEEKANKIPEVIGLKANTVNLFEKSEVLNFPDMQSTIDVSASIVQTNLDWLNTLLLNDFYKNSSRFHDDNLIENNKVSEEDIKQRYQKIFDKFKQELQEEPVFGMEESQSMAYIGQRNNIAQFEVVSMVYGGVHSQHHTQYMVYDLVKKSRITLNDLIPPNKHAVLKEKLLEVYKNYAQEENLLDWIEIDANNFRVSDNFYFDNGMMVFSYPLYELEPYALCETELKLSYFELDKLLTPEFKKILEEGYYIQRFKN